MAYNYGLLSVNYGLLWSIVACYFGLLGVPGDPYKNFVAVSVSLEGSFLWVSFYSALY